MRAASGNPTEHRESQPRSSDEALGLQRLVFFSDAVTAIAITLLAIDLRVPEIAASAAAAELPRSLSQLGPRFLSFVVSFAVIGTYWMAHHRYFRYIRRHDGKLMLLNMVFLFCIVLMPFVAGLFGQYYYLPLGMSVYAAAVAAIGLSVGGLWWYASWAHRLVDEDLDERFIRARSINAAFPALFLVSIPFASFSQILTVVIWGSIPLLSYVVLRYLDRKHKGRS
jgi:uncharacterized membrane protein